MTHLNFFQLFFYIQLSFQEGCIAKNEVEFLAVNFQRQSHDCITFLHLLAKALSLTCMTRRDFLCEHLLFELRNPSFAQCGKTHFKFALHIFCKVFIKVIKLFDQVFGIYIYHA